MSTNSPFRSLRYDREVLGVDLGSHTVKVLQLRVVGSKVQVVGYGRQEVASRLAEAGSEEKRRAVYAETLGSLLAAQKFTAKGAAFSLSGSASIVRFIHLKKPFKTDPRTGVPVESAALSPFESKDTSLEVRLFNDGPESADAMAVIAQKSAVHNAIAVLKRTRLRPAVALNDALALENAYQFMAPDADAAPVVILNIGAATTTLVIMEGAQIRASRTFNIAGDAWMRAVKRDLGVNPEDAESMKKEYGLFGHLMASGARMTSAASEASRIYNETSVRVFRSIDPMVTDLVNGVHHTIEAFREKRPRESSHVGKLLISGGGASLKSLQELLSAKTGLLVEVFDPLASAGFRSGGEGPSTADSAVVFGLAVSGVLRGDSSAPRMNLLPQEVKRAAARRNFFRVLAAVALFFGTLAALWGYYKHRLIELERQAEELARQTPPPRPPAKTAPEEPVKAAAPRVPPKPVSRFEFLGGLKFSGRFGDVLMLTGPEGDFVVRGGRLFRQNGDEVAKVSVRIAEGKIFFAAGAEKYVLPIEE